MRVAKGLACLRICVGSQYTIDAFFEVNIRICQPENSDVYRGEAEVNITFEG